MGDTADTWREPSGVAQARPAGFSVADGVEPLEGLVRLAAQLCDAPAAALSVLDGVERRFIAAVGVPGTASAQQGTLCLDAARVGRLYTEIEDLSGHPPAAGGALLAEGFRFYAGALVRSSLGQPVGALCVLDRRSRRLTAAQREAVMLMAAQAEALLAAEAERAALDPDDAVAPQMVLALDHALGVTRVDAAMAALLGAPARALLGRPLAERCRTFAGALAGRLTPGAAARIEATCGPAGRVLHIAAEPTWDGWLLRARDVTARRREATLAAGEARVQAMIADAASLDDALAAIARTVEEAAPGAVCSLMLFSPEGRVAGCVAPSLPRGYADAFLGVAIGPNVGSCGTAAWRKEAVVVSDIAADPLWEGDCGALALAHGLRACWSTPVFDAAGGVVATFAVYRREARGPDPFEREAVRRFVRLASIAIARIRGRIALEASERRLSALVACAACGMWQADAAGRNVVTSENWPRMTDVASDPDDPARWLEAFHPEDRPGFGAAWRVAVAAGGAFRAEARMCDVDGCWRWVEGRATPLRDTAGAVVGWIGMTVDLTERREVEERYRAVASVAGDAIWDLDLVEGVMTFGEGFAASLGHEGLSGRHPTPSPWVELIHVDDRAAVRAGFDAALRSGADRWSASYRLRRADGTYAEVDELCRILRDPEGVAVRAVGCLKDLTAQRETEARLRAAQRLEAVGRLTGGVAHDFNNLLTVIIGACEMMADEPQESGAQAELARVALAAAERGASLTQRLMTFARRQPLDARPVDVAALLGGMLGLLERTLGARISIATEIAAGLPPARIDGPQLESALLNLCLNARDAMPLGGALTIAARLAQAGEGGERLLISVADEGSGMDADTAARAIEPFFTTKPPGKGSGLGLSTVEGFIAQSGGAMTIDSAPGRGTTVTLAVPVAARAQEAVPAVAAAAPERGSGRILLLDADPLVRGQAARMLRALGYRVTAVAEPAAALSLLQREGVFDLLFADVALLCGPEGAALAERAARLRPALPMLLTAGRPDAAPTAAAGEGGGGEKAAATVLAKPYRRAGLAASVAAAIAGTRRAS